MPSPCRATATRGAIWQPSSTSSWPSAASAWTSTPAPSCSTTSAPIAASPGRSSTSSCSISATEPDRGAARRATLADVAAVIGDSAALGLDDLVHGVALGDMAALERCVERLLGEGEHPVRLVRAQANHFARLHRLAALVERGEPVERVIERARPPIHFRRKSSVGAELRLWSAARAAQALTRLLEAEIACKTTGWPARVLCQEALFAVCAEAAA